MLTLLHGSDLHFGKHFDPEAAPIFRRAVGDFSPDLLVLSGDFTQRAKVQEYEAARGFLDGLPEVPVVVTPGNHDVPLYRVWERAFAPLRNYRQFISPELDSVTRAKGATVVSLNSTAPHSAIVNGRLRTPQLTFAARAFQDSPETDLRVLVTHHNLASAPDYGPEQVLPGHRQALTALSGMGVELILGGHLHRSFSASSQDVLPDVHSRDGGVQGTVMAYCGTTTSRRGRTREREANSFNLLRVVPESIELTCFLRGRGEAAFIPVSTCNFPRKGPITP